MNIGRFFLIQQYSLVLFTNLSHSLKATQPLPHKQGFHPWNTNIDDFATHLKPNQLASVPTSVNQSSVSQLSSSQLLDYVASTDYYNQLAKMTPQQLKLGDYIGSFFMINPLKFAGFIHPNSELQRKIIRIKPVDQQNGQQDERQELMNIAFTTHQKDPSFLIPFNKVTLNAAKLNIIFHFDASEYAMHFFPGFFYSAATLPKELALKQLQLIEPAHQPALTKEEWIIAYEKFLIKTHVGFSHPEYKKILMKLYESKMTIDSRRVFLEFMLDWYQSPKVFHEVKLFLIGLGFATFKEDNLVSTHISVELFLAKLFFLDHLIPTLLAIRTKIAEQKSNIWAAEHNSLTGGITFFRALNNQQHILKTKYPQGVFNNYEQHIASLEKLKSEQDSSSFRP